MSRDDVLAWLGTELGIREFMRSLELFTTQEEFELLVRWASRREPHLSEAQIERIEGRAQVLAALLERWEPVGVSVTRRYVAEQVELSLG